MKNKSLDSDEKIAFHLSGSGKKVARKKRLTRRHGGGGRKKKDKNSDTSERKDEVLGQGKQTDTPDTGKKARPLSQSGWTEEERKSYKVTRSFFRTTFRWIGHVAANYVLLALPRDNREILSDLSALVEVRKGS